MTSKRDRSGRLGFTLIEIMVAISLLAIAFLGLGAVVPNMIGSLSRAEVEFLTLNAVEDRLELVLMDPRYTKLDSLYTEASTAVDGLPGARRSTNLSRTVTEVDNRTMDVTRITVTVVQSFPPRTVSRTVLVGAP